MYKLDLEKQRKQINCQHLLNHGKARELKKKKNYFFLINYAKAFDCVDQKKLKNS